MKKIFYLFIFSIIGLVLCQNVLAIGQISEPIIIENALRGEESVAVISVLNSEDRQIAIDLQAEGEIKDWTSFYELNDNNFENPITQIQAPAGDYYKAIAKFTVPEDTPNGSYQGQITVITVPAENKQTEGSSAIVRQKIGRDVSITVSDNEIIDFEASIIPDKFDYKKGETMSIRIIYYNHSNVKISPQFELKIKKINTDTAVFNAIYPYPEGEPAVSSLGSYEIPAIEVPTGGFDDARYVAEIKMSFNGHVVSEDFKFNVGSGIFGGFSLLGAIAAIGNGNMTLGWIFAGLLLVALAGILIGLFKSPKLIKAGVSKFRSLF